MAPFLLFDGHSWPLKRWPGPQPTTASSPTVTRILERQATVTVVSDSGGGGDGGNHLSGGAIAGIVIGSVVGVLLLLWIIRSCFNLGASPQERESMYHDVDPKRRHHHHSRHRGHHSPDVSLPPPVVMREHSRNRHRQHKYPTVEKVQRGRRVPGY